MEQRTPLHRRRWFQITVSVAILALLARNLDLDTLVDFLRGAHPGLLLVLALFHIVDRVFMAWKWHLLVRSEGTSMTLWTAVRIYLASGPVGLIIPLGGLGPDMARVAMLSHNGMPMSLSVPSIIVERACGILASGIMVGISLGVLLTLLQPESGTELARAAWITAWAILIVGGSLGACYAAIRVPALQAVVSRAMDRLKLKSHYETLCSYGNKGYLLVVSILLACVQNSAGIVAFYLAGKAFAVDIKFLEAAAIVPFAAIIERLPISWGGFGVREAGVVLVAGLFGIAAADALLLSIANYSFYLLTTIPLAAFYFLERRAEQRVGTL